MKTNIINKPLDYFFACHYAKKNDCAMEFPIDNKKCVRFEIHNKMPYFYWYWYNTGKIETIEDWELEDIFENGYKNESYYIATQFARIIIKAPENENQN